VKNSFQAVSVVISFGQGVRVLGSTCVCVCTFVKQFFFTEPLYVGRNGRGHASVG